MNAKRKKKLTTITFLALCIVISGCWSQKQPTLNNAQLLVNQISSEDENESHTALLLLSHIVLEDNVHNQLSELFKKEKNPIKKLFLAYTLSVRTQELKYTNAFIELYPTGKDQENLWRLSNKMDYVSVSTPLQEYLASMVGLYGKDSIAFEKLLSAYDYADGAYLSVLIDQLFNLSKRVPGISNELKTNYPKTFKSIQEIYPGELK